MAIIFSILTFFSTLFGGKFALRYRNKLNLILGFTAGVLLGVIAFDIFPEIYGIAADTGINIRTAMVALVVGFLVFHAIEKWLLIHHAHEDSYGEHKHPAVGIASALALCGHSFVDGLGIGLGFQVSHAVGIVVAIAVIAHDFSDGLNTVSLMLINNNSASSAKKLLYLDAIAPVVGAVSTLFLRLSEQNLLIYLGFFAGFLLYIGASDILPEAHSKHSSGKVIVLTVLGTLFIFFVSKFI